jgi:hypothetical protein
MPEKKNIVGFKKFSEIKSNKKLEEVNPSTDINSNIELPMNPNLPSDKSKVGKEISTKKIRPNSNNEVSIETNEKVETIGKVARFPKNVKASKAYNFLESVKISKKSIWYIMVEKDQELQVLKYNYKEGVDLNKFVNELKAYYLDKNKNNKIISEAISKISVDGNEKYSMIRGIPTIEVDGKKVITKITEDLIRLLSK